MQLLLLALLLLLLFLLLLLPLLLLLLLLLITAPKHILLLLLLGRPTLAKKASLGPDPPPQRMLGPACAGSPASARQLETAAFEKQPPGSNFFCRL